MVRSSVSRAVKLVDEAGAIVVCWLVLSCSEGWSMEMLDVRVDVDAWPMLDRGGRGRASARVGEKVEVR